LAIGFTVPAQAETSVTHRASANTAAAVPFPKARPGSRSTPEPAAPTTPEPKAEAADTASAPSGPSECQKRLDAGLAVAKPLPPITGPGACHAEDVVRLEAIVATDGSRIKLSPPPMLRCEIAEAVTHWVREQADPRTRSFGRLKEILVAASFSCRGRNNVTGARLSEHGLANAIDLRGFTLANGKSILLTDASADKSLREQLRDSACGAFTTVLGPGSDGYHEEHIHLDHIQRRGGYRMCQWAVREPGEAPVAAVSVRNGKTAPKAVKKATWKFAPIAHADGDAPGVVASPPVPITPRAARSASCGEGQACPQAASPQRERARRRAGRQRFEDPLAIFRW
jgi:hypothetical protein